MSKEIYISSTPHETRLAIVEKDELTEIYYERENEYTLAGSIYNGRVTRVLPGMQSSFVDIGLERDAFLYITDFMEEAPDSAEFDTTPAADHAPRAPRGERPRLESGGEARPEGGGEARSEGRTEGRSEGRRDGSREGRGDGRRDGRSRGRRDGRNRNRQSTDAGAPISEATIATPASYSTPDDEGFYSSPDILPGETPRVAVGEEIGEGAPGADGTRRWRGRRGRRRGRGLSEDGASASVDSGDSVEIVAEPFAVAEPVRSEQGQRSSGRSDSGRSDGGRSDSGRSDSGRSDGGRRDSGRRGSGRRDGQRESGPRESGQRDSGQRASAPAESTGVQQPSGNNAEPRSEGAAREGGRERSGRRRGGRGERNDRAPREDRGERNDRAPREDRGNREDRSARSASVPDARQEAIRERFAPRGPRNSSRNEETIDLNAAAAPASFAAPGNAPPVTATPVSAAPASSVEPFILPGESLSKYRRSEPGYVETAPKPSAGILVTAKPSSEVAPLVGWDGGATLPGETLSRRSSAGATSAPRTEARTESRNDSRRDFDRGGERSADRGGDRGGRDRGNDRRRGRDEQRGRGGRSDAAPRTEVSNAEVIPTSFRAEPRGLDPADAVQPAVSSQHDVLEAIYESQIHASLHEAPATETVVETHAEFHETTTEYEPGDDASASFRVDPAGTREFRQSAPVEEIGATAEHGEHAAGGHEFTSIQPSGEMLSEPVDAPVAPSAVSSPIEHEAAVQSVSLHDAAAVPFAQSQGFDEPQEFAPGAGQLEEEELDEEETEVPALHASAHEEVFDEEALEHAADLGMMIRDRTIQDVASREPVVVEEEEGEEFVDEEEDFEEDEMESSGEAFEEEEPSASDLSESEEGEFAEREATQYDEEGNPVAAAPVRTAQREGGRRGRRDGRRDGRRSGRERSGTSERSATESNAVESSSEENGHEEGVSGESGSSDGRRDRSSSRERSSSDRGGRDRSSSDRAPRDRRGMANSRDRRSGGRTMQTTDLPSISDLLKPGQEILVQIAKEPIAKKGARITSHIALPGRFLVFMPTVSHTGVSRKIESDAERRRLKEILLSERGDATGGFIVRTAAAGASEEDLRSDLRFLLNLWAGIKERSESSKSPALIYHDLNLIERILRDQVTDNFSAIWVDTEAEYERVIRFLQRFQPALVRRVKLYEKEVPLYEQFGINAQIDNALRAKVWLKSGGSIVINQTEALVAIDINTGKYVGKTAKLEDTILKTNLDAIPEIVRQMRLRDLGGIIIIDFIDMDERRNRNKVMAALEEELKKDRAPSKVLQFNDFGLIAITRKRVKQTLERTLSTTCGVCAGTGMVKSPITVCNDIYIEMRKMHKLIEKDIMLRVHPEVVKQLKLNSGKWLTDMETLSGKTILLKSDPTLHPEQFDIH